MPAVFLNIANFGGSNRVFFYCFDEQKKSENKHDYIRYLSSQVSSRGIPVLCWRWRFVILFLLARFSSFTRKTNKEGKEKNTDCLTWAKGSLRPFPLSLKLVVVETAFLLCRPSAFAPGSTWRKTRDVADTEYRLSSFRHLCPDLRRFYKDSADRLFDFLCPLENSIRSSVARSYWGRGLEGFISIFAIFTDKESMV